MWPFGRKRKAIEGDAVGEPADYADLGPDAPAYVETAHLKSMLERMAAMRGATSPWELVAMDVATMEAMLAALGVTPVLRTDMTLARRGAMNSERTLRFYETGLTPTGKLPKYPLSAHYMAYEAKPIGRYGVPEGPMTGSHGTVWYLPDGTVGKADVNHWRNNVRWGVSYRRDCGGVFISKVVTNSVVDGDERVLYAR